MKVLFCRLEKIDILIISDIYQVRIELIEKTKKTWMILIEHKNKQHIMNQQQTTSLTFIWSK